MVDKPSSKAGALFLDTSVIVASTVEVHPSHDAASAFIDEAIGIGIAMHISSQVCREFMVVMTRQPVSGRTFTLEEALTALSIWTTGCLVLEEGEAVLAECLDLVKRFGVHGKQVHDCNIVATMKVHGVRKLVTLNASDFKRYVNEIELADIA